MMNNLSGKTAILYRRVSTTEQKDFGMSLSNQTERLQDFCKRNSVEIIGDFEEDYSAKNFSRPNFSEMLKFVVKNKNRIDYLLIYKWDRFSRNAMEAMNMISQFKGLGVEVNCSDQWINHEDPNQLIMLLLNLGMPQVDNMIRKDRTVEGTRNNLKAGRWVLNQPKGYLKGRDEMGKVLMKPDPEIATLISDLFKDFSLGIYSQNEIRQLVKYRELKLSKSGVSRILNQITYSGQIRVPAYKDEPEIMVDALHQPLVSKEVYNKVQVELGNRKRIKHKPIKQNDFLPLRGFLECSCCGSNLTGSGSKSKTGKKHYYYHCNNRKGCKERYRADQAHNSLNNIFEELKPNKEVSELFEVILKEKFENSEQSNKSLIKSLNEKIIKVEKRKSSLLDKFIDEAISQDAYSQKDKELYSEQCEITNQINQLNDYEKDTKKFIDYGLYLLNNLGSFFSKASVSSKQKILSSIFNQKLVFEEEKYRTPILNKGIELISQSISILQKGVNKNERQSYDYLPFCTRGGT